MSSRKERKKNNRYKDRQPQPKNQGQKGKSPCGWTSILSPTGKFAAAFVLLLTVSGSYYSFSPKLTISASDTLNPQKPFATKFEITNESVFRVNDVIFKYRPRGIFFNGGGSVSGEGFLAPDKKPIPFLESGETTSLLLPAPPMGDVIRADIEFVVSYRPSFLPFQIHKKKRFTTEKGSDNTYHWLEKAISE